MRASAEARESLRDGFDAIRRQYRLAESFPSEVERAAQEAAKRIPEPTPDRRDARDIELATLDPAGSTDLDQAFALATRGGDIVLSYAIADVAFFVDRGGVIEAEAWRRGATVYLPDGRVPQYPTVLSEGAASLLPDVDRPAVLLTVVVDPNGDPTLENAERVVVRSRSKLAYESLDVAAIPLLLTEFSRRIAAAEDRRGANRIEFPEPEVQHDDTAGDAGAMRLVLRRRLVTEDVNSAMSLAANLAVAARMAAAGVGVFRVMAEPDERELAALHRCAVGLSIDWPGDTTLRSLVPTLDPSNARHVAFLLAARRAGGGATYASFDSSHVPWHAAVAATYAHATAPLRRLADRYVLDLVVELMAGSGATAEELETLAKLPALAEGAETIAANIDRECIDLVEAVMMHGRVGQRFPATVIDVDGETARIQLLEPPVRGRLRVDGAQPGSVVQVVLVEADSVKRVVRFASV